VGLEYVGEALLQAGVPVHVLDLVFAGDWKEALSGELTGNEPLIVGLSVRNTDDCCFATGKSFLPWVKELIGEVRMLTDAFILLGGAGFSVMPEPVLRFIGADAGIVGDGEEMAPILAEAVSEGKDFRHLPNLVCWRNGDVISNPRTSVGLERLAVPGRRLFDNPRYEQLGAMVGVETKRGCNQKCIFCADPVAKGREIRVRPPETIIRELQSLVGQGVTWFYICDSEFNLPIIHAKEVCRAVIESGLADKIRWYCYCSPVPFDRELAELMKRAGCAGINFGVDSLNDVQLARLGRGHSLRDVELLVKLLHDEGINYIFDFLFGGPGETDDTIAMTIERVKELDVPLAGIAAGVRVYSGTPLAGAIANGSIKGGLHPAPEEESHKPVFYLSPQLSEDVFTLVNHFVAGDQRFLVLAAPDEEGSYNYAGDDTLGELIRQGARGAYWDILRRNRCAYKE
jgi:radical SAM superfamily enzyme YgiQ (UPF0313 family)